MKIFVTGAAGFVGYHLCKRLLKSNYEVIGFDNVNSYYDKELKESRLKDLKSYRYNSQNNFTFIKGFLEDNALVKKIFFENNFEVVIHLAAQAGVRYSLENPYSYINSNILGFTNILENSKSIKVKNLIFASSSSVYGGNEKIPFLESDSVDHPVSLYAATKKSNELMAHCYSHIYDLPVTGLRFFTVYGPWGRPDMAPMIFANSIFKKQPIKIFNNGNMARDFTYIDDVVEIIYRLIDKPAIANSSFEKKNPTPESSWCPYKIFNVGNSDSVHLMDFIEILEKEIGIPAIKIFEPMQPGDVRRTAADTSLVYDAINFKPKTSLRKGIKSFIDWYKEYYKY